MCIRDSACAAPEGDFVAHLYAVVAGDVYHVHIHAYAAYLLELFAVYHVVGGVAYAAGMSVRICLLYTSSSGPFKGLQEHEAIRGAS